MIKYELDQSQLNKLREKLNPAHFQKAIDIALKRIGFEVERGAKIDAPYKTGNLRRSIRSEQSKTDVTTGTNLVYAAIHEFGGNTGRGHRVRIQARPYLTPQLKIQQEGRAIDILTDEINRIL